MKTIADAFKACQIILARDGFHLGCVVTLGELGSVFGNKKTSQITHFECLKVKVVDSTVRNELSIYYKKLKLL